MTNRKGRRSEAKTRLGTEHRGRNGAKTHCGEHAYDYTVAMGDECS